MSSNDYSDIRPYNDAEVPQVLEKLCNDKSFMKFLEMNKDKVPGLCLQEMYNGVCQSQTIQEFQNGFSAKFVQFIVDSTSAGLTLTGIEHVAPDKKYLFVSNHRDIILDSGMISASLYFNGFGTTQIAIGSNLLIYEWISDIVRLNKAFIVKRNAGIREFLTASKKLSAYIREVIVTQSDSVWIAQREGRTKDGNDQTQLSMLKMLNMSNKKSSAAEGFSELNIIPVSISYEYEPCTRQKVLHTYMRENDEYFKTEADDLFGMYQGLIQPKGRIAVHLDKPIDIKEQLPMADLSTTNEVVEKMATLIDQSIYRNYQLYPAHYIAYDILYDTQEMAEHYSDTEKQKFIEYSREKVDTLEGNRDSLLRLFLSLYATPLKNKLNL